MSIKTEISVGEFLDKITILQIKKDQIKDTAKLVNINKELDALLQAWQQSPYAGADIREDLRSLRSVNEKLWEIENAIREKEAKGEFDDRFIELARSVYVTNDKRAVLKKGINQRLGSGYVEEKSYKDY